MSNTSPEIQANILKARTVCGILPSQYQVPYNNIGELLRKQIETHRNKPWLIFYSDVTGRHEYTYEQFHELVCKTANFLLIPMLCVGMCIDAQRRNWTEQ